MRKRTSVLYLAAGGERRSKAGTQLRWVLCETGLQPRREKRQERQATPVGNAI